MIKLNKILLLMCHWLGDTFWAMQVIPYLKKQYPEAEIWVGIKPHSKDLLYGLIDDDKIIELNNVISDRHREKFKFRDYCKELTKVRKEKFDLAIDLTGNRYSALFLYLSGIKRRVGLKTHKLSFLYNIRGDEFNFKKHLMHRPFQTVNTLFPVQTPEYLFPVKTSVTKIELQNQTGFLLEDKLALIMPGSGWPEKMWDIENFVKVGNKLTEKGFRVIISGSNSESNLCNKLSTLISDSMIFIKPLSEFIALIPNIYLAVTNDSGPAHLFAAGSIKTLTIFCGNTEPQKCGPIGRSVKVIKMESKKEGLDEVLNILEEFTCL